jgi:hypothetical protein
LNFRGEAGQGITNDCSESCGRFIKLSGMTTPEGDETVGQLAVFRFREGNIVFLRHRTGEVCPTNRDRTREEFFTVGVDQVGGLRSDIKKQDAFL